MAGRLIQCPHCTWEQHHATHGLALKALDKHLPKCPQRDR